jgi:hypothetical protein
MVYKNGPLQAEAKPEKQIRGGGGEIKEIHGNNTLKNAYTTS